MSTLMSVRRSLLLWLTCLVFIGGMDAHCEAGSGRKINLPSENRKKIKNGIVAEIETRWVEGFGYRPVTVTLAVRRIKQDRTIQIDFLPESHSKHREPLRMSVEMEIPQGEREVSETFYLPQQTPWNSFRIEFFEDRRKLKDLSMQWSTSWANVSNNVDSPCVLLVDKDAPRLEQDRQALVQTLSQQKERTHDLPDARKFQYIATQYSRTVRQRNGNVYYSEGDLEGQDIGSDFQTINLLTQIGNLEVLPPIDLPLSYIGLSGIDLIVISLEDLKSIAGDYPDRFRAIDFAIRNGSNLIVYHDEKVADEVTAILGCGSDWRSADRSRYNTIAKDTFVDMSESGYTVRRKKSQPPIPRNLPPVETIGHGLGRIAVIEAGNPYARPTHFWQWVCGAIGTDRLTWKDRHGISLVDSNQDYWDFMIPGFGASPVESFLAVITVFILCIGPLNFWFLKKSKRLYLLPITVGAAALLTTVTMLVYALVSDGIRTRVRLQSFTMLDERDEQHIASTHSRHSYLASITPANGLIFPREMCVYPVEAYYRYDRKREEFVNGRSSKRRLKRGYVAPRTTMQFMTTGVENTDCGLAVDGSGSSLKATNRIDVDLQHAWLRDDDGKLFYSGTTAVGQPLKFEPTDEDAAIKLFKQLLKTNKPTPPAGIDKTANNMFGFGGGYSYYSSSGPSNTSTSLLHKHINRTPSTGVPDIFKNATPNRYLVVSDDAPPFVHVGTKAIETAGFHVVMGTW